MSNIFVSHKLTIQRPVIAKWIRNCSKRSCSSQPPLPKDLSGPYPNVFNAKDVEDGWYQWWKDRGYFQPRPGSRTFSLVLPPPNVTGTLHLGHALTCAVEDALVRWHRMRGHETVWVPGSDHAGIATQVVVEKSLAARGIDPRGISEDEFLDHVWKWKAQKGDRIFKQLEVLGASLDWERTCFTLSDSHSAAVNAAFHALYRKGLIYRGDFLVNWSCQLQSAISDIEVDHIAVDKKTKLPVPGYKSGVTFGVMYDFAYPVHDSSTEAEIVVSTTRPETMLGDVAVAVHPADDRFTHLHGKLLRHPFHQRLLPVITDAYIDPNVGTGAMKVTPGHDHNDFVIGQRHRLEVLSVIDGSGRMAGGGRFNGMPRFVARSAVVKALEELGLLRGRRDHSMQVPVCSRSGDVVEPMHRPQWFLRTKEMAEAAMEAADDRRLELVPKQFYKIWEHWLKNNKDWCISRQLVWGHRIPLWEVSARDAVSFIAARDDEDAKSIAVATHGADVTVARCTDVLDTWFSSAIVPFANFGWPDRTEKFYPLSMMETGHDILFFWVARMVMMGLTLTGRLPFNKVFLHGMICDAHGRKMSKSLGNVVDPLNVVNGISLEGLEAELDQLRQSGHLPPKEYKKALDGLKKDFPNGIPTCGTDALRFGLCSYDVKGQFINLDMTKMKTAATFSNKIWQLCRFLVMALDRRVDVRDDVTVMGPEQQWILSRCASTVRDVNRHFENNDFHFVTKSLRRFLYTDLCDTYVEMVKPFLSDPNHPRFNESLFVLHHVVVTGLKLLHPVMPFITEELYQRLESIHKREGTESIMIAEYPIYDEWAGHYNERVEGNMAVVLDVVRDIRRVKLSFGVRSSRRPDVILEVDNLNVVTDLAPHVIATLAQTGRIHCVTKGLDSAAGWWEEKVNARVTVLVDLKGEIDSASQIKSIEQRMRKLAKTKDNAEAKLRKVDVERERLVLESQVEGYREELENLQRRKVFVQKLLA